MTLKEKQNTLFEAIQLLMKLYQDVSDRTEPVPHVRGSELKKIAWTIAR